MTSIREEVLVEADADRVWSTDVLPDELSERIAGLMQTGAAVAKATLERDLGR